MQARLSRRTLLQIVGSGVFAFSCRHSCDAFFAAPSTNTVKRCVVLWMDGGPSQMETFDPKARDNDWRPHLKPSTLRYQEFRSPSVATQNRDKDAALKSIIRNLASPEGDHDRGNHFLHTGYPQDSCVSQTHTWIGGFARKPRSRPSTVCLLVLALEDLDQPTWDQIMLRFRTADPNVAVSQLRELTKQRTSLRRFGRIQPIPLIKITTITTWPARKSSIARIETTVIKLPLYQRQCGWLTH
ncbi:MAG UNVERIFIED_CONTAM: DUF1501 domain-containing protein [Microcystis novacekii LVE1205-3]|jgi:hypothetical protein